jgi:hypothetical protein
MKKRWFLFAFIFLPIFTAVWLSSSGRLGYFTLNRHLRIEVNGLPVRGEILTNKVAAIVTIRDTAKKHSYLVSFEGDVDSTGDIGSVIECNEWVAPHLPLLFWTRSYPPCKHVYEDGSALKRLPLIYRGNSMQFVTKDHSTIALVISAQK